VDNTAEVQKIEDESKSLEEEIAAEESSEDTDKDFPDEVVVDEPKDDIEKSEEEPKSESK
jgi:hypothetical protein